MPKHLMQDPRYDFRGGLVTGISGDLLNANELVQATNVRLINTGAAVLGGMVKRGGTRRMHSASINGNPILGLTQWDGPNGKQLVATSNGNLYYRDPAAGDFGAFTGVVPGTLFSTSQPQTMVQYRQSGGLNLYVADSAIMYRWSGSALTAMTNGTNGINNADVLAAFHTRLFAKQGTAPKQLMWSKVGDAETWISTGLVTDPGSALVSVLSGESITALEVIGSSLLIASPGSVSRFTGYSSNDIQLASDTEGLSSEIGAVGPLALKRFETAAALLSKRGPYIVTEGGLTPIGMKLMPDWLALNQTILNFNSVAYHKGKREIWFAVSGPSDAGSRSTIYVYSIDLQAWTKFTVPFDIRCMCQYQRIADGTDTILAGCGDSFIRDLDTTFAFTDDILFDGTGGSSFTMTVEPAPHFFESGLAFSKSLDRIMLDVNPNSGSLVVQVATDALAPVTQATLSTNGHDVTRVDIGPDIQGRKVRVILSDSANAQTTIYGYALYAWDMRRRD